MKVYQRITSHACFFFQISKNNIRKRPLLPLVLNNPASIKPQGDTIPTPNRATQKPKPYLILRTIVTKQRKLHRNFPRSSPRETSFVEAVALAETIYGRRANSRGELSRDVQGPFFAQCIQWTMSIHNIAGTIREGRKQRRNW